MNTFHDIIILFFIITQIISHVFTMNFREQLNNHLNFLLFVSCYGIVAHGCENSSLLSINFLSKSRK